MREPANVVIDIETLAYPPEFFDQERRNYLLKPAPFDTDPSDALHRMHLSPLTARVIAIALLNPDSGRARILYEHPEGTEERSADGRAEFVPGSEEQILRGFWSAVAHYPRLITFNGRAFDGPFLMLRSALLGVVPSRNLVPYRFSTTEHCDLLDQLTMYGATRRFSLDFYCRAFGIASPKGNGITGLSLGSLVAEGRYREVAEYCLADARATAELFRRWETYLSFKK
jgi:hypothetical protein